MPLSGLESGSISNFIPEDPKPSAITVTPGQLLATAPVDARLLALGAGKTVPVVDLTEAASSQSEAYLGNPLLLHFDKASLRDSFFNDAAACLKEANDSENKWYARFGYGMGSFFCGIGWLFTTIAFPLGFWIRSDKVFGQDRKVENITDTVSRKDSAGSETDQPEPASADAAVVPGPESAPEAADSAASKVPQLDLAVAAEAPASRETSPRSPSAVIPDEERDRSEAHPRPQTPVQRRSSLSALSEEDEAEEDEETSRSRGASAEPASRPTRPLPRPPIPVRSGPAALKPAAASEAPENSTSLLSSKDRYRGRRALPTSPDKKRASAAPVAFIVGSEPVSSSVVVAGSAVATVPAAAKHRLPDIKGKTPIRKHPKVTDESGSVPADIGTAAKTNQITVASLPQNWLIAPKTDAEKAENFVKKVEAEIKHYVKTVVDAYKTISRANRGKPKPFDKDAHDVNDEIREPVENKLAEALAYYAKQAPNTQAILSLYKLFTDELRTLAGDTRLVGKQQVDVNEVNSFIAKTVREHVEKSEKRKELHDALLEKLKKDFLLTYVKTDAVQAANYVMSKVSQAKKLQIIDETAQAEINNSLAEEFGKISTENLIEDLQDKDLTSMHAVEQFLNKLNSPLVADQKIKEGILGELQNNTAFVDALIAKITDEFAADFLSQDPAKETIELAINKVMAKVRTILDSSGIRLLKAEDAELIRTAIIQVFFGLIQDVALDKFGTANGEENPSDIYTYIRGDLIQNINVFKLNDAERDHHHDQLVKIIENALVQSTVAYVLKQVENDTEQQPLLALNLIEELNNKGALYVREQFETKVRDSINDHHAAKQLDAQMKQAAVELAAKQAAEEAEAEEIRVTEQVGSILTDLVNTVVNEAEKEAAENIALSRSMFVAWRTNAAERKKARKQKQEELYAAFNTQVEAFKTAGAQLSAQIEGYNLSVAKGALIRKEKAAVGRENLNVKVPLFTDGTCSSLALHTVSDGKDGTIVLDIKYSEPREITVRDYVAIREAAERLVEDLDIRVVNEALKNTITSELASQTSEVIEKLQRSGELATQLNLINEKNRLKEIELEQTVSEFNLMITSLSDFAAAHGADKEDSFAQDKQAEIKSGVETLEVLLNDVLEAYNKAVPPKAPSASSASSPSSSVESAPSLSPVSAEPASPVVAASDAPAVESARPESPVMASSDNADNESVVSIADLDDRNLEE